MFLLMTQQIAVSRGRRVLISLAWGLVQLVITATLFFFGGVAGGGLAVHVFDWRGLDTLLPLGFVAGVVIALWINHSARGWVRRLRLLGLRRQGTAVDATVLYLIGHYISNPRAGPGIDTYVLAAQWTDPVTGATWEGQRTYRFRGRAPRRFKAACADGAKVGVYYPPGRPSRFVIDIPFAPTMADLL